jgi:TM2 domain-containing membrane protein YozV/uncharacterized Zn finger protein (UPF0148 family)
MEKYMCICKTFILLLTINYCCVIIIKIKQIISFIETGEIYMKCPLCGAVVPDGSKFCTSCGFKIENDQQTDNNSVNNSTDNINNNSTDNINNSSDATESAASADSSNNNGSNNGYNNSSNSSGNNNGYNNSGYNQNFEKPQKSRLVAGLLGIFLGELGIHNFYLGFTKKALIQLLVSILSCGTLSGFMWIWGLVEGIFYLSGHEGYTTDSDGRPLGE